MGSSDATTIPKVISLVTALNPRSILDVGTGHGKYGLMFREYLDLNYGRELKGTWKVRIDGVEADYKYVTEIHRFAYDDIYISNWAEFEPEIEYDFLFMGDVLEHFEDWQSALLKAKKHSVITMVVAPNWPGSTAQGKVNGHEFEDHKVALTPSMVGGRCIFANSKIFMSVFDNHNAGVFDSKNFSL